MAVTNLGCSGRRAVVTELGHDTGAARCAPCGLPREDPLYLGHRQACCPRALGKLEKPQPRQRRLC